MTKFILAALMAFSAAPTLAQTATGPNNYVASPGIPIADTGPRYCPELADTEHPFRAVCPSWPNYGTVAIGAPIGIAVGQGVVGDNRGVLVEEGTVVGNTFGIPEQEDDQD